MEKFEAGDIVKLRSGSPEMTVTRTEEAYSDGRIRLGVARLKTPPDIINVWCEWVENGLKKADSFDAKMLQIVQKASA